MGKLKQIRAIFSAEERQARRADADFTRTMQSLLVGIESPYRKISWKIISENSLESQALPQDVATEVQVILNKAGLNCAAFPIEDTKQYCIKISSTVKDIKLHELIAKHKESAISEMDVSEDLKLVKSIVSTIDATWNELNSPKKDLFNLLRIAPPVLVELAEAIDDYLVGLKIMNMQRSSTETAVLSPMYYSNLFLNIFARGSPELFKIAFKETPIGPLFIAGYQIVSDAFYTKRWQEGRAKHLQAQFTSGDETRLFSSWHQMIHQTLSMSLDKKVDQIRELSGLNHIQMIDLMQNNNLLLIEGLWPSEQEEVQRLLEGIKAIKDSLVEVDQAMKSLTKELRKKASRLNTEQQVLMATKHFDRMFNLAFICLSIGAFFFPPLAIPTVILSIGTGLTRKTIIDQFQTGASIVQGLYEVDNHIVLSKGANRKAKRKAINVKKMNLEYTPPALVGMKLGSNTKHTIKRTQKLIQKNPEYTLYIGDSFHYTPLGVKAKRSEIRGQIDSFSLTCRNLIFHLGIIQGRDANGDLLQGAYPQHPPYIHNIEALKNLIEVWKKNLIVQIHDQQLNPQHGKNSYFSDKQIKTLEALYDEAKYYIDDYQNTLAQLDRKEYPKAVQNFDMKFVEVTHQSILDEIKALKSIVENKDEEQRVINADSITMRLNQRLNNLMNYCDKCPDPIQKEKLSQWKAELETEINELNKNMSTFTQKKVKFKKSTFEKSAPETHFGIRIQPSSNEQIFLTVQHPRFHESRNAMISRLKLHVEQRKDASLQEEKKAELVLLPVSKVTDSALFSYKGSYLKMIWLIRSIDRALESIELTLKNKDQIRVEINPENLKSLIEFYRNQLDKINDYRSSFTFSQTGKNIVVKKLNQSIQRTEALLELNQRINPSPQN
jgi:hypothetical protein